jgi:deoxyribose-phosphate aldolase
MELAATIDHTKLAADTRLADIDQLCREALEFGFAAVCVPPNYVAFAAETLAGSSVAVATVVGFPMGYSATVAKVAETRIALESGATEIDMVVQIAALQNEDWKIVAADVRAVLAEVRQAPDALLKVIIESCYLNDQQLEHICKLLADLGVDFVKTSTGYGKEGASVAVIAKMRAILPKNIRIKASGGIKTRAFALELLKAGADRIGTSSGTILIKP